MANRGTIRSQVLNLVASNSKASEKLCECGCGESAPIAASSRQKLGIVRGSPLRFVYGHHRRGVKHSEEAKTRMSLMRRSRVMLSECSGCGRDLPRTFEFFQRQKPGDGFRRRCKECISLNNEKMRLHRQKLRADVIAIYGGKCYCCGEEEPSFLTLDHTNGNGAEHRRAITGRSRQGAGYPFYAWLRRNGYPKDGYGILCMNCNSARGWFGGCPHTSKLRVLETQSG